MKALVNHTGTNGKSVYPYIGIVEDPGHAAHNLTVLFVAPEKGVCLSPGKSSSPLGRFDDAWDEKLFVPLKGEITLSNE
jgi:hypothetical protein